MTDLSGGAQGSPFLAMREALNIVYRSPHPVNRIAATVFNRESLISSTNHWPARIAATLGTSRKIGGASGTVHGEVSALMNFKAATAGASLAVTEPFCPNCAHVMAAAGTANVYINSAGFKKDFAARRLDEFNEQSMTIAAKAGINVYEIDSQSGEMIPLYEAPDLYVKREPHTFKIERLKEPVSLEGLQDRVSEQEQKTENFGCAVAVNSQGYAYLLTATVEDVRLSSHDKYDTVLQPLNRLLAGAARHGLSLADGYIYTSHLPTSREQVNLMHGDISTLFVGTPDRSHDPMAVVARAMLEGAGILKVRDLAKAAARECV